MATLKERTAAKKAILASGQKFTLDNMNKYFDSQSSTASQPTTQKTTKTPSMLSNAVDAVKGAAGAAKDVATNVMNKIPAPSTTTQKTTQTKSVLGQTPSMTSAFTLPEEDKVTPVTQQTQGEQLRFEATPAPTVATPESPVKSITATDNQVGAMTPQTDRERTIAITAKQIRAAGGYPELSDEELNFMIDSQLPKDQTSSMQVGQDALNQQISDEEARMAETQARMLSENEQKLADYSDTLEKQYGIAKETAAENGELRKEETRRSMSFSGFGRSTANMEKVDEIQKDVNTQIDLLESTKEAEKKAYEMQLAGATAEQMEGIRSQISSMRTSANQMAVDVAMATAEMNSANQVSTTEAIANIMATLPAGTDGVSGMSIDKNASELLGYVADEYGNPVMTDEEGNPVAIKEDAANIKYSSYTDPYTGQQVYYDPYNPLGSQISTGNSPYAPVQNQQGYPSSATTSNSGERVDITDSYGGVKLQHADNCALFARDNVPNIPMGASSIEGRREGLQQAQDGGYGGFDKSQIRIGDAIHTTEGQWGHSAIVRGFDEQGNMVLEEANYTPGRITYGRTLSPNDPKVMGYVRPEGGIQGASQQARQVAKGLAGEIAPGISRVLGKATGQEQEIPKPAVTTQVGVDEEREVAPPQYDQLDMARYAKALDSGTYPTFTGASQQAKDAKEADFKIKAQEFAAARARGDVSMEDYDREGYREVKTDFEKSDYGTDLSNLSQFNSLLDDYMGMFEEYGFEVAGSNAAKMDALHKSLLIKQKELDKLGVLAGPDMDIINAQIPALTGFAGTKNKTIYGSDGIQSVFDDLKSRKQKAFERSIQTAKSAYSPIANDIVIQQYQDIYDSLGKPTEQGYQPEEIGVEFDDFYNNL